MKVFLKTIFRKQTFIVTQHSFKKFEQIIKLVRQNIKRTYKKYHNS